MAGLGVLIILVAFPFSFFLKEPAYRTETEKVQDEAVPISSVLRNKYFYLLAAGSMLSIAAVGGTNQHLKLYLRDLDFTQKQAANLISLVALSSLAGRVLMGWLADLYPRKNIMILIYLIVATAIPLLLLPEFPGRMQVFAVIFGIGLGGDYLIIPLMAGDLFGIRALGRVMGIILVADGMAESLSPKMVGALYDMAGENYLTGFAALIAIALSGALLVSFLPRYRSGDKILMHS